MVMVMTVIPAPLGNVDNYELMIGAPHPPPMSAVDRSISCLMETNKNKDLVNLVPYSYSLQTFDFFFKYSSKVWLDRVVLSLNQHNRKVEMSKLIM